MLIDRLIGTKPFNEERFKKHLQLCKNAKIYMPTYAQDYNPNEFNGLWYAQQLILLITLEDRGVFFPKDFVAKINANYYDFESGLFDYMLYTDDESKWVFLEYSNERKFQLLLEESNEAGQKILQEYQKDKDVMKLIEAYYDFQLVQEVDEIVLEEDL